jgi:hypothetical protein
VTRVLIANRCGLLSALPTLEEYRRLDFMVEADRFVIGVVEATDEVAAAIQQQQGRVRVLLPELPPPLPDAGWLYVAVVKGELVLV